MNVSDMLTLGGDIALYLEIPYDRFEEFLCRNFPLSSIRDQVEIVEEHKYECTYLDKRRKALRVVRLQGFESPDGASIWIGHDAEIKKFFIRDDGYLKIFLESGDLL
jgi:hypothetical protein